MRSKRGGALLSFGLLAACGDSGAPSGAMREAVDQDAGAIVYRDDVQPVTSAEGIPRGIFIPPYLDCREPKAGETGSGPDGKVCTHVLVSGCTEPGKYYPDYASCDVVRTQRPFWDIPPPKEPDPNDPRLQDEAFMAELAWVTEQIEACACTCCHDSRSFGGRFGEWDIARGPIWLDTLTDTGLALFAGLADSSQLGAFSPEENHGFDRVHTGIPTTDTARMQAFMLKELERRGISEAEARAVPPFGGPLVVLANTVPEACKPGVGVSRAGVVNWSSGEARYVYVMEGGSKNPGVAPNLDVPEGTLWRLDVMPDQAALRSGIRYGTTPDGSFQYIPEREPAPALVEGETYHFVVMSYPGLVLENCEFTY